MIKRLQKLELIELPVETKAIKIRFPQPSRVGLRVLSLKNIYKSYGDLAVYKDLHFDLERGWKMAFVGHNGAGKSTLLKVLAGVIPIDSGQRIIGPDVKVGYFSQHREGQLDFNKTIFEEALGADRGNPEQLVRSVLGSFLFPGDMIHKRVSVLSGGEKSRLSLVKLLLNPPNVLLMDEPTTHLDMASVDGLIDALKSFEGTICFISHDLYFLNALADHVVHIDGGKITVYPGDYDYFKHRQAQWHEENPQAVEVPALEKQSAMPEAPDPKKIARRTAKLQGELHALHQSLEELAAKLSDPELYADYAQVQSVGSEMEKVQELIQSKESELQSLTAS